MAVGADSGTYEFDIAVSFAGDDREYVEGVVDGLKAADVRVFYDTDHAAEMWGEDLIEYFEAVYSEKSRYAIIFVSRAYAEKMWTRHERRSALARGLQQDSPYVLPVRLDDTSLPGLRSTVGYQDARQVGLDGLVGLVLQKLAGGVPASPSPISRVPRTEVERQRVLLERPPGWEYLYLAAELLHQRELIEGKYLDYDIGFATRTGEVVSEDDVFRYVRAAADEAIRLAGLVDRLMDAKVQERAMGAPGEPGDPERILHLAERWNSSYEGFIDWVARLRGATVPSKFAPLVASLAAYAHDPIVSYRAFIDELVTSIDLLPKAVATGEKLEVTLTWTLRIAPEALAGFDDEIERLRTELD